MQKVENNKYLLCVGDKITRRVRNSQSQILTITRTTRTQAIAGESGKRFKREIKFNEDTAVTDRIDEIGGDRYSRWGSRPSYSVTVEGDAEEIADSRERQKLGYWFNSEFKPTPEQIKEIYQRYGQPAEGAKDQE